MLKIKVDLQKEYDILLCERRTANLRRKANEGQHCFVTQDVKHREELEYLLQQRQSQAANQSIGFFSKTPRFLS